MKLIKRVRTQTLISAFKADQAKPPDTRSASAVQIRSHAAMPTARFASKEGAVRTQNSANKIRQRSRNIRTQRQGRRSRSI
jgi:hypothetical protein